MMPSLQRTPENDGSTKWTNGLCEIGIRTSYTGSFSSTPHTSLRMFVGDGSKDAYDYALLYPFAGNAGGDFSGT